MFSSYLAAAWRSFLRDRLYALINIIGLAIGLSAALLSGLYIHNELTFEQLPAGIRAHLPDLRGFRRSGFSADSGGFLANGCCALAEGPYACTSAGGTFEHRDGRGYPCRSG